MDTWEKKLDLILGEAPKGSLKYERRMLLIGLIKEVLHAQALSYRKMIEGLRYYVEHKDGCVLMEFSEGRPTKDGRGYEQKFNGKWYQKHPVDKTPKCTCGLAHLIQEMGKGEI
jgi:hypothetical protein